MIQFLNPIMFAALAAVVVPIVLHLLSRSRFRTVDWGAMMFLPGRDTRRTQASRLRQWALLSMRCGLLAVLATSLALPQIRIGHSGVTTFTVVILDNSASMAVTENQRSRMDRAREAAINLIAQLHSGDSVALLRTGEVNPAVLTSTTDLQAVAQQILSTEPTLSQSDFALLLQHAARLCKNQSLHARIFIVSDRQGNNWQYVSPEFIHQWIEKRFAPITWIPVGSKKTENVAIDSLQLISSPAIANLPTQIAVQIHNYGLSARGSIHLSLTDQGQTLATSDLTLEARESRAINLPVSFSHAGQFHLTATIDINDLPFDNTHDMIVDVAPRLPVLIFTGQTSTNRFRHEADFLQLALCPFPATTQPTNTDRNPCAVRIAPIDQCTPDLLNSSRVVILANVPALSADQLRALEQFTYTGGGLIIAPGNLVRSDDFNQTFYRNGTGLSPASLAKPTSADAPPTSLLGIDLSHPVFQFLKTTPDPIPQATIARYFPANPHGGDVQVLSSYATGEPFVVEGTFGHGHVLLLTTPLSADWSNLPLSNFYLPFVQSCVKYLCSASMSQRNLMPGEMIAGSFPAEIDPRTLRVILPNQHTEECDSSPLADRIEFRFGPVHEPGEYIVRAASPHGVQEQSFIVDPPASESDLIPLSAQAMDHLQSDLHLQILSADDHASSAAGGEQISLWIPGIVLTLALAICEMFFAGLWGRGLGK
ncbi:MAG TPA: BatA domain-containing protein [Tepidisphaeraceae bacterium]|jgi:hypothetical protein